jgi:hypothetical protein
MELILALLMRSLFSGEAYEKCEQKETKVRKGVN